MTYPSLRRRSGGSGRALRLAAALLAALALAAMPVGQAVAGDGYEVSEVTTTTGASVELPYAGNSFAVFDGQLYFHASDAAYGVELWTFDGVTASRVTDIEPGPGGSYPSYLTVFDGALYFEADNATSGSELWKWDGSAATRVLDLNPGSATSNLRDLAVLGTSLVFGAEDGVDGQELWSYSGGTATQLADINPTLGVGSNPYYVTTVGGTVFFNADDGVNGDQLWAWNGTTATMLTNLASFAQFEYFTEYQGEVYFSQVSGTVNLWRSDGTVAGTQIVPGFNGSSAPTQLYVANSILYLGASLGSNYELWSWDGATATRETFDESYPESSMIWFDGQLFFGMWGPDVDADNSNDDAVGEGAELWRWNHGTTTSFVADLSVPGSSVPKSFIAFDGAVYFEAFTTDLSDPPHLFRLALPEPDPELAATGSDPAWPLLAAAALVLAGAGIAARRRARRNA